MCSVCWISAMVMDAWMIEAQSRYCWSDMILWNMRIINLLFIEMTALWERDRAQRAECSLKRSPLSSSRKWQENLQEMLTQWFQCAIKGGNTNIPAQLHNLTMEKKNPNDRITAHSCHQRPDALSSQSQFLTAGISIQHSNVPYTKRHHYPKAIRTDCMYDDELGWWGCTMYDVRLLLIIQSM